MMFGEIRSLEGGRRAAPKADALPGCATPRRRLGAGFLVFCGPDRNGRIHPKGTEAHLGAGYGTQNPAKVPHSVRQPFPCIHFVGFKDDRYWNAVAVFGRPHFIHRWWDKRARREIADGDIVVFATGDWTQEPHRFNAPDIDEETP